MRELHIPRAGRIIRAVSRFITAGRFMPDAITCGTIVTLFLVPTTVQLVAHELAHWKQAKAMGNVRYFVRYAWLFLRFGYWNHPMEVDARRQSGEEP